MGFVAAQAWFFMAVAAAVLWGLSYALSGRMLHMGLSPAALNLFLSMIAFPCYLALAFWLQDVKPAIALIKDNKIMIPYLLVFAGAMVCANFLIMNSIAHKNATVSSLIEISYPFFTLIFAYILFREVHINWASALGAVMIFSGITLIFLKG